MKKEGISVILKSLSRSDNFLRHSTFEIGHSAVRFSKRSKPSWRTDKMRSEREIVPCHKHLTRFIFD